METAVLFGIFIGLFCLNVPIAVSLATAAIVVLWATTDFTLYMIAQRMFSALLSPPLLAIPAFVFAGVVMAHGGISKYLIGGLTILGRPPDRRTRRRDDRRLRDLRGDLRLQPGHGRRDRRHHASRHDRGGLPQALRHGARRRLGDPGASSSLRA